MKRTRRSPLAPRPQPQSSIPMSLQPVKKRERIYIHRAVLALRKTGRTVYRHGSWHCVDGRHLDNKQLMKTSRAVAAR